MSSSSSVSTTKLLAFVVAGILGYIGYDIIADVVSGDGRVTTISTGEEVDLDPHITDTGYTLVKFTADWCPGCKMIQPEIDKLMDGHENLNLRIIEIENWNSPVAAQFGIRGIPQLWLFRDGEMIASEMDEVFGHFYR